MSACSKNKNECALGCLLPPDEEVDQEVEGLKCMICSTAAKALPGILQTYGCSAAEKSCALFKTLGSSAESMCKSTFSNYCPAIMQMIKDSKYDSEQVCSMMNLC
jgi:Saposin-like type B, region 2